MRRVVANADPHLPWIRESSLFVYGYILEHSSEREKIECDSHSGKEYRVVFISTFVYGIVHIEEKEREGGGGGGEEEEEKEEEGKKRVDSRIIIATTPVTDETYCFVPITK